MSFCEKTLPQTMPVRIQIPACATIAVPVPRSAPLRRCGRRGKLTEDEVVRHGLVGYLRGVARAAKEGLVLAAGRRIFIVAGGHVWTRAASLLQYLCFPWHRG